MRVLRSLMYSVLPASEGGVHATLSSNWTREWTVRALARRRGEREDAILVQDHQLVVGEEELRLRELAAGMPEDAARLHVEGRHGAGPLWPLAPYRGVANSNQAAEVHLETRVVPELPNGRPSASLRQVKRACAPP